MTLINVRVDNQVKKEVEEILNEIGMNMSSAINIYLKAIIREKKIPFELSATVKKTANNEVTKEEIIPIDHEIREISYWVLDQDYVSISKIQRQCNVGFNKAGRLFDKLVKIGAVDKEPCGSHGCKVNKDYFNDILKETQNSNEMILDENAKEFFELMENLEHLIDELGFNSPVAWIEIEDKFGSTSKEELRTYRSMIELINKWRNSQAYEITGSKYLVETTKKWIDKLNEQLKCRKGK